MAGNGNFLVEDSSGEVGMVPHLTFDGAIAATETNGRWDFGAGVLVLDLRDRLVLIEDQTEVSQWASRSRSESQSKSQENSRSKSRASMSRSALASRSKSGSVSRSGSGSRSRSAASGSRSRSASGSVSRSGSRSRGSDSRSASRSGSASRSKSGSRSRSGSESRSGSRSRGSDSRSASRSGSHSRWSTSGSRSRSGSESRSGSRSRGSDSRSASRSASRENYCVSSISDDFNRSAEDPLSNGGNWGGSEVGDAYTDGTTCRLPVDGSNPACAPIWQTPVCEADQEAEMDIASFDHNLSYGLILRNDSASGRGDNFWYGRTVGHADVGEGQIDLFKCVGGSLTNEASTGFSFLYWGASSIKLTCYDVPTPGVRKCETDKGSVSDDDTDVPGSAGNDYVGMRLAVAGGETSGTYSADNFAYTDL